MPATGRLEAPGADHGKRASDSKLVLLSQLRAHRSSPCSQRVGGVAEALARSAQIAMFVVPVVCLVGWGYNHPFSLDMDPLLTVVLALAVVQTCGRERRHLYVLYSGRRSSASVA